MEPNVSESTRQHSEMLFKLFAFLAETCIFLELGLSVFGQSGKFQWQFIGWAILAALVGRAASIYPLAACYNLSLTKVVKVPAVCGGGEECYGDAFVGGGLGVASGCGPSDNLLGPWMGVQPHGPVDVKRPRDDLISVSASTLCIC